MKNKGSKNNRRDNRRFLQPVNRDPMKENELRERSPGEKQEWTRDEKKERKKSGEVKKNKHASSMKDEITAEIEEKDIKKEFEIRSGKENGRNKDKKMDDTVAEMETVHKERRKKTKNSSWRRPFKGDAEILP